ncbi:MAG: tRNA (guanosine(37)-N1)-methyltransferase TrmD [Candidatus Dadabacteria bacterium]|nr:tRNA (guanosine(37)-N1)-methyltransferase TrmD [Candidatus Dadabacteria bacterium]MYA47833.1 tRNA (guanosine(37)-N1)-methyltransferase TrmD [Candidatus Dadabacteria bacterium]MYF47618.1 tRNA (guanosine(37)-N1)-methyltransferase TrmD [Candidatus Dadabacteria bacterium]MYG82568.1 tRNA (guanosine(37)-N1)-methyltransferase TrmD [Candidatus Dadabacteria bacterium]MYK49891.1 tRNA (guanosine(37)-N1)-methyltransferase TrmD [Candidatus Dadabacteria bacterium]
MKFDIVTIFPDFFESVFSFGVISRAVENKTVEINVHDLRTYSPAKHGKTDDTPYGGGSGMLMTPGPIGTAINSIREKGLRSAVILTTPKGEEFNDRKVQELCGFEQLIILCGRYEGVDDRVNELYVDMKISTGKYINSGGEYACSLIVDAVSRYLPGVLGNTESLASESLKDGLLEYPQYTKPRTYRGKKVPEVLISGDHEKIRKWRRRESIKSTFIQNPASLDDAQLSKDEDAFLKELKAESAAGFKVYIALVHHPVYNSRLEVVSTAFKSIDAHDISRDATTYGVRKFYLINPVEEQRRLAGRLVDHWIEGEGKNFNETKSKAFGIISVISTIEEAVGQIEEIEGEKPKIVATDARFSDDMTGYRTLREKIFENEEPFLILFGTGSGLTLETIKAADYVLRPISGYSEFNHLSVRSAAAIVLDRLLSCGA